MRQAWSISIKFHVTLMFSQRITLWCLYKYKERALYLNMKTYKRCMRMRYAMMLDARRNSVRVGGMEMEAGREKRRGAC